MNHVDRQTKTFFLASVAVAVGVWDFAFNLGAFNTIFFNTLFNTWVISLAILLAALILPRERRPISGWWLVALASPTVWLLTTVVQQFYGAWGWLDNLVFYMGGAIVLICVPYVAFILVSITQSEMMSVKPRRLLFGLIMIAFVVGLLGYLIGSANYLLLTCEDFKLSGYDQPTNCWVGS